MLGKIVQLKGIPLEDGFKVIYGMDFSRYGTADLRFAQFVLGHNPWKDNYKVVYCWDLVLLEMHDGFKKFRINNHMLVNCNPPEEEVEERLWAIIPLLTGSIKTTAKKIAGRYLNEAILEMHAGDTVEINKACGNPEVYMAVQAGKELFLIKKNR